MANSIAHDFADRLDQALTGAGIPRGRTRTNTVVILFHVSRETARLWLNGRMPSLAKLAEVARRLNVSFDWLATGSGPMRPMPVDKSGMPAGDPVETEIFTAIRLMTQQRKRALLALLIVE